MHELAIALHLVELVEAQAFDAGAERVTQINLRLGDQAHVVPASLVTYFELLTSSKGSLAKGAKLAVTRVPMTFYCDSCEVSYPATNGGFDCPECQRIGRLSDPGDALFLESLEVI